MNGGEGGWGGEASGGGIYVSLGTVSIYGGAVTNCSATGSDGASGRSEAVLPTLPSRGGGGGGGGGDASGGGVYVSVGSLSAFGADISNNAATGGNGGDGGRGMDNGDKDGKAGSTRKTLLARTRQGTARTAAAAVRVARAAREGAPAVEAAISAAAPCNWSIRRASPTRQREAQAEMGPMAVLEGTEATAPPARRHKASPELPRRGVVEHYGVGRDS